MAQTVLTYEEVLAQVRKLGPVEQADLLEELAGLVKQQLRAGRRRSIREFRGLGKEMWAGIDAQEYVNQERESWTG